MKRKIYKVYVGKKLFIRTISKSLAIRTAKSAIVDYGLQAEIKEAYEEYNLTNIPEL
ncbi:hypothetical protein [Butyrivibrio proteoclasticus]|uniref:hypothetical protein n=1 Tax=Butyrivibrio proteoclasticus TaxID=43305 RepID=UPI0012DED2D6|nr:hypothetical protein [Butyrivibrio proteoclasticus]